ncbi:unnamed protein product [Clonostachys rosea]|uniref:Fungal N-terminal domain-containing protein n=1 Tax=Bionectria ochroleuca TaxID=29856 RepID=A0ABY6U327_BIOOC|nr:unnamed protein product [Clonostachys rosea]
MEAVTVIQLALSGLAFARHIPQIQSDYSELCNEIGLIQELCDQAEQGLKQDDEPSPHDGPLSRTKVALEEISSDLARIKTHCEHLTKEGKSEASKWKWIVKESKISLLLSKAQKAKMDLNLALGNTAVMNLSKMTGLQNQIGQQVNDVGRRMAEEFLEMRNEAARHRHEMANRENRILGEMDRNSKRMAEIERMLSDRLQIIGVAIEDEIAISQPRMQSDRVVEVHDEVQPIGDIGGEVQPSEPRNELEAVVKRSTFVAMRKRCSYDCRCRCHPKLGRAVGRILGAETQTAHGQKRMGSQLLLHRIRKPRD